MCACDSRDRFNVARCHLSSAFLPPHSDLHKLQYEVGVFLWFLLPPRIFIFSGGE